ncbi:hypothetical protein B0T10DRAFT_604637 [Thelonectria olida]|uniref:UDP-glucose/GDP-mannose dehydrogenase dimerisation domain-containing protein n=1 Tax=Thelonectria olida TaxID=1576542 RepID=A0A9P8WBS6_9HYPO|nr:hypothetical protein B0T10DRAFT_604637 [Thelonectria olida]
MVGRVARRGSSVVIESSVAVGMTRQLLGPLAVSKGPFAGMSPERVDPGRVEPLIRSIPKIVSGLDDIVPGSVTAISDIYSAIFDKVLAVSKPEVAEMMKLYENCQRMVCIAYANEMADACIPHSINPYEVCAAASTKPFGYTAYAPGVGVGGHCIPVNPFYLLSNSSFPLLEACSKLAGKPARVLVAGLGFKPGQSQVDNSPGVDLVRVLSVSQTVQVAWADALVKQEAMPQVRRLEDSEWPRECLMGFDVVVVAMKQEQMDFGLVDEVEVEGIRVERWCRW